MNSGVAPLEIVTPLTLAGSVVRLEPLSREHAELLWEAAKDAVDDIFRWIPYPMKSPEDFSRLVARTLDEQQRGESIAFATVERRGGRVIGSTRFMNIDRVNRRVEIGSTWIIPAWQRTAVNTEAKYLMLRHAFEVWQCFWGGTEDRCLEPEIARRHLAARRQGGRHPAQASDHLDWESSGYGLFQHPGWGMAGGKSEAGSTAFTECLSQVLR